MSGHNIKLRQYAWALAPGLFFFWQRKLLSFYRQVVPKAALCFDRQSLSNASKRSLLRPVRTSANGGRSPDPEIGAGRPRPIIAGQAQPFGVLTFSTMTGR